MIREDRKEGVVISSEERRIINYTTHSLVMTKHYLIPFLLIFFMHSLSGQDKMVAVYDEDSLYAHTEIKKWIEQEIAPQYVLLQTWYNKVYDKLGQNCFFRVPNDTTELSPEQKKELVPYILKVKKDREQLTKRAEQYFSLLYQYSDSLEKFWKRELHTHSDSIRSQKNLTYAFSLSQIAYIRPEISIDITSEITQRINAETNLPSFQENWRNHCILQWDIIFKQRGRWLLQKLPH